MARSKKDSKTKRVVATFMLVIFVIAMSGTALGLSKRSLKRTSKEGPVTIKAVFLNPIEKSKSSSLNFEIKLDTHTVDLDEYPLADQAFIRFNNGSEEKSSGLNKKGSGHHISYVLSFPGSVPDGTTKMTLIIRDLGGVDERFLEWDLPVK